MDAILMELSSVQEMMFQQMNFAPHGETTYMGSSRADVKCYNLQNSPLETPYCKSVEANKVFSSIFSKIIFY